MIFKDGYILEFYNQNQITKFMVILIIISGYLIYSPSEYVNRFKK